MPLAPDQRLFEYCLKGELCQWSTWSRPGAGCNRWRRSSAESAAPVVGTTVGRCGAHPVLSLR